MVGIKNIAVNIEKEAILFDFSVDEEEYQEFFIDSLYPMMTEYTKFGEDNNIIVQRYIKEQEERLKVFYNYKLKYK